jgi:protein TonB
MTKIKIKVVDVDIYEDVQLQIQDNIVEQEPIPEPVQEVKVVRKRQPTVKKAPVEEVKPEPIPEPIPEITPVLKRQQSVKKVKEPVEFVEEIKHEPIPDVEEEEEAKTDRKVRVQELVECPDCHKMITPKSFKYSHKKRVLLISR